MAKANIGPTGYGTWGILWEDFIYMERRGGYSGPFDSRDDAAQRAREIANSYDEPNLVIVDIATVNP